MFVRWLNRLIPSRNQRVLNSWRPLVARVGDLEERMRDTTNADFKGCRARWREQLDQGAKLDDMLVEVYASVREVARRRTGMRHFDAQILGGIALHNGKIGEMATGEGKTLVATLPAVLNALRGGTHIITVNEYLAQRDSQWMGEIYRGLGLEVATVFSEMKPEFRRQAYQADITYGTNSEFGFDYLRDNMCLSREDKVQGTLNFAIVDEVDSILIDEARTPLIISGVLEDDPGRYIEIDRIVVRLQRGQGEGEDGDFTLDEKNKRAHLSERGQEQTENMLREAGLIKSNLYDPLNTVWLHHLDAALRARFLYHKDVDYVVRDGRVHIVDVFTGRIMHGRRWSSGLHQAVEAKEGATIQPESQTLASITLQNYFRMYDKLSGMTGTASTEAPEFMQIYGVEVVTVPTNKPNIRLDNPDRVFLTLEEKYDAIVEEIHERNLYGQPVLVGTVSIENSELISAKLKKLGVKHMVLNAKQHEQESFIVANAGNFGAVTIATNMAGRGTDIVLGGNLNDRLQAAGSAKQLASDAEKPNAKQPDAKQLTDGVKQVSKGDEQLAGDAEKPNAKQSDEDKIRARWEADHERVVALGGLHIIGSERHESRRIDNQLRGRCARQGDPGSTRFYLSLQDNLMRIFASDAVSRLMSRLGLGGGEAIEHSLLTRAIINAQRKVEVHNFEMRKNLLDYDNVVNQQRRFIYEQREQLLDCKDPLDLLADFVKDAAARLVENHLLSREMITPANVEALGKDAREKLSLDVQPENLIGEGKHSPEPAQIQENLTAMMRARWDDNFERLGPELASRLILQVAMQSLDRRWREHLSNIDYIKQGIHLRSYAQKQPIQEFKREAFGAFFAMIDGYRDDVCGFLLRSISATRQKEEESLAATAPAPVREVRSRHEDSSAYADQSEQWLSATAAPGTRPNAPPSAAGLAPPPASGAPAFAGPKPGRNQPCHCGSGKKFKHCHGR